MRVHVVGAGMAGLLAAGMLRKQCDSVFEASESIPNNHSAVLRFRSSVVGDTLNIPFKAVDAIKAVHSWRNPIADAMAYSLKTNGTATLRSVLSADGSVSRRYIAPTDMIQQMVDLVGRSRIALGVNYSAWHADAREEGVSVISTIPMPALMDAIGWEGERPEFSCREGANVLATLDGVNAYCSLYVPDPDFPAARISITGNQLIAECYERAAYSWIKGGEQSLARTCAELIGLNPNCVRDVELKRQKYAKILPIDEGLRREFIMWASEVHGVFSLGRFATWRPGLLLDDVVNDVRVIQQLIRNKGASYAHKLKG